MQSSNLGAQWNLNYKQTSSLLVNRQQDDPRIKVAIFDTGLCSSKEIEQVNGLDSTFGGMKNFMDERSILGACFSQLPDITSTESTREEMADEDGHGTHLLGRIIACGRPVEMYIGKIISKCGGVLNDKRFAQVCIHLKSLLRSPHYV